MFSETVYHGTISALLTIFCLGLMVTTTSVALGVPVEPAAEEEPLSVILMIGDGMGYEHVKLARWVELGRTGHLRMERYDFTASVLTHSASADITDSAAAGTALATGVKTINGRISKDPSGANLETILEIAEGYDKSTGVVSTCFVQHATPATFYAHVQSRSSYGEITRQAVEEVDVEVILGGGSEYFSPSQLTAMEDSGYSVVTNRSHMLSTSSSKILGLFSESHMPYEQDRDFEQTPSLGEMTEKSIDVLSQDPDGFFLMVEGGRIDHAGHDNDKVNDALDTIAFDEAVGVAIDYVQSHSNTILMVTADHECGGLTVMSENLSDTVPDASMTASENRSLRVERATNVTVSWISDYHTAVPVPLYCFGEAFENLPANYTIDNTDVFDLMNDYYTGTPLSITNVTTSTTSSTTTTSTETTTTSTNPPSDLIPPVLFISIVLIAVTIVVIIVVLRKPR
ncbi:MAG: alkaline phosphatase [Candidatus Lokiarchaeota archaeon]|nr:alkaline phosphatase [Candidatus Lokiarchaeota archaeon]